MILYGRTTKNDVYLSLKLMESKVSKVEEPDGSVTPPGYWADTDNVRKYFEEFAAERNMDPLNPEDWYNITTKDIIATKQVWRLLLI